MDIRKVVKDFLRDAEDGVAVTFIKSDGSIRHMLATLNDAYLPERDEPETVDRVTKSSNPDLCVVWDLAEQAWRSFRWDRLICIGGATDNAIFTLNVTNTATI